VKTLMALWTMSMSLAGGADQATEVVAAGQEIREQLACAPISLPAPPLGGLRVLGGDQHGRIMFGPGEPLIINAGTAQGIKPGQQYFVRRHVRDPFTPSTADFIPVSVHTAGWVTIVDADEGRQTGYAGLLMLVNRGSDHGVRAGQTLTIFRETLNGQGPIADVGRATVMSVRPQTALVRIDSTRGAVYVGDFAAIHRITQ